MAPVEVPIHLSLKEKEELSQVEDVETIAPPPIDAAAEKALLRKVDLHVVPPLVLLFFLAFLDRVNIGNAKIQFMTRDLHMKGHE